MRHASQALLGTAVLLLAGCAMPVVAPPAVPAPVPPAQQATPAPAPLTPPAAAGAWTWSPEMDSAAARLRSALGGDVDVVQTTDQRLWLSLPGDETFPAGRSAVTPAGRAWLDEVALALRNVPRAEAQIVGAPDAKRGGASLALDRAASARDWMVARGVAARRVAVSGQAPKSGKTVLPNRLEILIGERSEASAR
jgi:outer membrane protein OmpA-like peptidoglycan-associated protein